MTTWPGDAKRQRTTFGKLTRAELMARVRSRGNKTTEERFTAILGRERITGWRRHQSLFGNPDFVWRSRRLAVFLDGCFWHGHTCRNLSPRTNARVWTRKIEKNKARDRLVNRRLRASGWIVLRIWECELETKRHRWLRFLRNAVDIASQSR